MTQEIEFSGPVRGDWPNYSKLSDNEYHCHLKKGKPNYVAVWREIHGKVKVVEIAYVILSCNQDDLSRQYGYHYNAGLARNPKNKELHHPG